MYLGKRDFVDHLDKVDPVGKCAQKWKLIPQEATGLSVVHTSNPGNRDTQVGGSQCSAQLDHVVRLCLVKKEIKKKLGI